MQDAPASRHPVLRSPIRLGSKAARNLSWMSMHATLPVKGQLFTDERVACYAGRARQVAVPGGPSVHA